MGNRIKNSEKISKEQFDEIANKFLKNKVKSAYITKDFAHIRYKPLSILKTYSIDEKIEKDFENLFINMNIPKTFSNDKIMTTIFFSNNNFVLLLFKDKKILFNCERDLCDFEFDK